MVAIHPAISHLAFLAGTWRGEGHGVYPTIEDFAYREEVVFAHSGKPFLFYQQKTWRGGDHADAGMPLHSETGYLRPGDDDRHGVVRHLELVIAQPTGITEVHTGTIEGTAIRLRSVTVGMTPTAKPVTSVERNLVVSGATMRYELFMAAVDQDHQIHLTASLEREDDPSERP